jgi:hypothetical protein
LNIYIKSDKVMAKKTLSPFPIMTSYAAGLIALVLLSVSRADAADEGKLFDVQAHLYSGTLAEAEKSGQAWSGSQPADQTARFALASVHFFQAVEALGQGFHRYGVRSIWSAPFLRLPIPPNPNAERATYQDIRRVLDDFYRRLQSADAELSQIELNGSIDYPLDIKQVRLNFTGIENAARLETLWAVLDRVSGLPRRTQQDEAPNLIINFDAADVVWLRGYCHLLSAIVDFLLAHDWQRAFETTFHNIFPNSNPEFSRLLKRNDQTGVPYGFDAGVLADLLAFVHLMSWPVIEPERMRSALKHLETMVVLSRKNWELILAETDDHNEWIPGPKQTPMLPGVRVTEERVTAWQNFLNELEALLQGRKLIPHYRFDKGINLRKFFLEPTAFDPVLLIQGSAAVPYLENGEMTTAATWRQILSLFEGNFFAYFVWFN